MSAMPVPTAQGDLPLDVVPSTTGLVGVGEGMASETLPADLVWAAFTMDMATGLEQAMAADLTRIGGPQTGWAFDGIDGVPVRFAWSTDTAIAVLADPSPEDV